VVGGVVLGGFVVPGDEFGVPPAGGVVPGMVFPGFPGAVSGVGFVGVVSGVGVVGGLGLAGAV